MEIDSGDMPFDPPETPVDGGVDGGDIPEAPIDGGAESSDPPAAEEFFLAEVQQQREEQQQAMRADAAALSEKFAPDGADGTVADVDTAVGDEVAPLGADSTAASNDDTLSTMDDEALLKDIQHERDKRQQEIRADAEALRDEFGPLAVDGSATDDPHIPHNSSAGAQRPEALATVADLERRVEDVRTETYAREAAERAKPTTTAVPATDSQPPEQPGPSDDQKTIHPRPESVEKRQELEPNPEFSPVTIIEGKQPQTTEEGQKQKEGKTDKEFQANTSTEGNKFQLPERGYPAKEK
jgi:hypothetical protein